MLEHFVKTQLNYKHFKIKFISHHMPMPTIKKKDKSYLVNCPEDMSTVSVYHWAHRTVSYIPC